MDLEVPNRRSFDEFTIFSPFEVSDDGIVLDKPNYHERMQGYSVGIQNGFMSPNDVRELEDMDLIPEERGGDTYMVNGNMVDLSNVGAAYVK